MKCRLCQERRLLTSLYWDFSSEFHIRTLSWVKHSMKMLPVSPAKRDAGDRAQSRASEPCRIKGAGELSLHGTRSSNASFGKMLIQQAGRNNKCVVARGTERGPAPQSARASPERKHPRAASKETFRVTESENERVRRKHRETRERLP